jgi:hypothetical protein
LSKGCARFDGRAQDVARGDHRHAVALADARGLRAFAGSRRTDEDETWMPHDDRDGLEPSPMAAENLNSKFEVQSSKFEN